MRGSAVASLILALACGGQPEAVPELSLDAISEHVRSDADDRSGWATDVRDALRRAGRPVDADHVCQVLAILEQESGYEADPAVPGLAAIVEEELSAEAEDRLGFLGDTALEMLLDVAPEGSDTTFRQRLRAVETERDVDVLFREMKAHHATKAPRLASAVEAMLPRVLERLNPVSTAGSMQVSVQYAQDHPVSEGLERDAVRDLLYTRHGGVLYGTLRLFDHDADYDDPVYRFADFNAGQYASRNAAFQSQVADLTATELAPDGDLLIWTDRGTPANADGETVNALMSWRAAEAPDFTEARLRWELRSEKTRDFEDTKTWDLVRASWAEKHGSEPPYARVPDVALDSPKLSGQWTTRFFAEKVQGRYETCLARGG